jgi:hypothetical protein
MMTLTSDAFKTCARVLRTYEPSCTDMLARLFFMFEARIPHETTGHVVAAPESSW